MLQFFADLWTQRSPLLAVVLAADLVFAVVCLVAVLLNLARGDE